MIGVDKSELRCRRHLKENVKSSGMIHGETRLSGDRARKSS